LKGEVKVKKTASGIMLILLFVSVLSLAFNIQPVKASGTVYIRADGSIDPPDAPISTSDNVTYTLTDNITSSGDGIIVERDNIIIDGDGYTVQGSGADFSKGIDLTGRSNVTTKNTRITAFYYGIELDSSSGNSVSGNNITANNRCGIELSDSSNNSVSGNNIMNNCIGIGLYSNNNSFSGNNIANNDYGIYLVGSNNAVSGNNITANNDYGISIWAGTYLGSSNNSIYGNVFVGDGLYVWESYNNVVDDNLVNGKPLAYLEGASNLVVEDAGQVILVNCNNITIRNLNLSYTTVGVQLWQSNNSAIINNNITANKQDGVELYYSNNNSFSGNNIANNSWHGIDLHYSSGNKFYHNNFYSYDRVYSHDSANVWDDGYPSGGNYWKYYADFDLKSGSGQDQPGSDGIGDAPYIIDADNRDRYPLMNPWSPPPEHELVVSITAPASLQLGSSSSLDAIVTNQGLNDEVNVVLSLFINGTKTNSTTIPLLQPWNSYSLSYVWIPTVKGTYNVTAYATPVPGETSVENNQGTTFIRVVQVGVKAGDWIKYDYTVTGWPAGTPYPKWLKVEFLGVEGTNATIRVTMHMSDGTEQNATVPVDIVAGGQAFGLSGFVVSANLTTGDIIFMSGYGNVTIEGETTSSYAGASRTVVYASFSQYGTQLTYYWDKRTGVMVEASVTSGIMTGTGKATETNIWQAAPFGLPIEPIYLILAVLVIIIAVGAAAFIVRRKKKAPEEAESP
jgi:parallel beta-helix repeat protein